MFFIRYCTVKTNCRMNLKFFCSSLPTRNTVSNFSLCASHWSFIVQLNFLCVRVCTRSLNLIVLVAKVNY